MVAFDFHFYLDMSFICQLLQTHFRLPWSHIGGISRDSFFLSTSILYFLPTFPGLANIFMYFAYILILLSIFSLLFHAFIITPRSWGLFSLQMGAFVSQGPSMMHCGSHWATLLLKHKLISCSTPPRINRGPSTCFLSRFCLFLFPPSHLTLSPPPPPPPTFVPCILRCWHGPVRARRTVTVCARRLHTSVCSGRRRRCGVRVRGIKTVRARGTCREIGKLFTPY